MIGPSSLAVGAAFLVGSSFLTEMGDTDCESLGGGALAQPVNALTSFAYVVVGAVVAIVAVRRGRELGPSLLFAALLAAIGLGSVAFHGPQPTGARLMHDLPILLTAIFIAVYDAGLLRSGLTRWAFPVAAPAGTAVTVASPDAGVAATGVALVIVAVLEVVIYRRGLRPQVRERQRRIAIAIIVVIGAGGASWLLGRTDSPACDPDGVFQFHGLWHVLSALAFGAWWWMAIGTGDDPKPVHDTER